MKLYYENGKLEHEWPYKKGKRHGVEKWYYYENDQLLWEIPYINGKKHGSWKGYYENGQLMWEIRYDCGKLIQEITL